MEERLAILSDAMRAFAEVTSEPKVLLDTVVRHVARALDGFCSFARVSDDGKLLEFVAMFDEDPDVRATLVDLAGRNSIVIDSAPPVFARALASGRPTCIPITEEVLQARFPREDDRDQVRRLRVRSLLFIPLRAKGKLVGGINLLRHGATAADFDSWDIELAQSLADHAALAIANAQLLARTQRLSDRLRLLSELAQEFAAQVNDGRRLLALVAQRVCEVVGDGCVVRMVAEDRNSFETPAVIAHADPRIAAELDAFIVEHLSRFDQGITRRVATTGQTMLVPVVDLAQLEATSDAAYRAAIERIGVSSILVVPLRVNGLVIGVCALGRTSPGSPYTDDERQLAEDVAIHAALAIGNSRLLETSRRALAERLRMSEASRLKSEFLANMSHELRTPLNAIIGFASLMHAGKVGPMSEVHREYVGDILGSGRHLLQLINDVLDLSKIEAGRMELRLDTVDLARIAAEAHAIVRGLAIEKRLRLTVDVAPDLPAVRADARLLKQILYNYLSNAIKFTHEGGAVALRISANDAETVRIDVEDTGIGIRLEDMKRLFVEFQQLDQGGARSPGTGLGLALTKRLVEAHGGRVVVASTFGTGSTFSAILPRG